VIDGAFHHARPDSAAVGIFDGVLPGTLRLFASEAGQRRNLSLVLWLQGAKSSQMVPKWINTSAAEECAKAEKASTQVANSDAKSKQQRLGHSQAAGLRDFVAHPSCTSSKWPNSDEVPDEVPEIGKSSTPISCGSI
jgi:hypothetical protein